MKAAYRAEGWCDILLEVFWLNALDLEVRLNEGRPTIVEGRLPKAGGWPSDRMLAVQLKARVIELTAS